MASEAPLVDPWDEPPTMEEFDNRAPCETYSMEGEAGFVMVREQGGACQPPWDLEPEQRTSAPLAEPTPAGPLLWPVETEHEYKVRVSYRDVRGKWHGTWGYHLGAKRQGSKGSVKEGWSEKRYHSGVDLHADEGDKVLAAEAGEVIGMFPFHHGTWSVYVRSADGRVINYGELAKDSWEEFGFPKQIIEGETQTALVEAGQPLGRVGRQTGGGTMLHFEMYTPEVTLTDVRAGKMRWPHGQTAPPGLFDPTKYLVSAQQAWFMQKQTT